MGSETLKSELIEWLTQLEDEDTLDNLKMLKDANDLTDDWGSHLTEEQRSGIERGLKDVDKEKVIPHDTIKAKYGL